MHVPSCASCPLTLQINANETVDANAAIDKLSAWFEGLVTEQEGLEGHVAPVLTRAGVQGRLKTVAVRVAAAAVAACAPRTCTRSSSSSSSLYCPLPVGDLQDLLTRLSKKPKPTPKPTPKADADGTGKEGGAKGKGGKAGKGAKKGDAKQKAEAAEEEKEKPVEEEPTATPRRMRRRLDRIRMVAEIVPLRRGDDW